jgi:phenylalanyl-tRNA synthetase beta chain
MIVSWNWLKQYVLLDMPAEELEQRLMMAGLNHESTQAVGDDLAIDLEVTSNRPDCLGHLGIAREVAVLWNRALTVPPARPPEDATPVASLVGVRIDCPELCARYTARVVRGVKVGPSPAWLVKRLTTVGVAAINNIVDISNYVMLECGQPLHTFDYGKLRGPQIIVRRPQPGEQLEAIDHKTYALEPSMCVIADAQRPVAIGGVMGGAPTEVSAATRDVLIEAADFDPISIRATARRLNLHSPSSYRFERRVDPEGLDWASRRCAELILELAGGTLAAGVVDVGQPPPVRAPIALRLSQLPRILGIEVPASRVREILVALGNCETPAPNNDGKMAFVPPSWRRDLSREIDLIEEVGRIHGYEQIPEDVGVPMVPSARRYEDRVEEKIARVLTSCGFDEAMTLSATDARAAGLLSPWTEAEPLRSLTPVIRGADRLRTSLIPSLLEARRTNESLSNPEIELFEIAKIYLPNPSGLPTEKRMLGLTSGRPYPEVRGVLEAMVAAFHVPGHLTADVCELPLLDPAASCRLLVDGELLAYVGRLADNDLQRFELRGPTTVAELRIEVLVQAANLVPQYAPQPAYPAVTRDLNLVVDEAVRWGEVAATVGQHGGTEVESLQYRDTYRDPERLGAGKKSLLFTVTLRSKEATLTNQQADAVRDRIVVACRQTHGAELRA